MIDQVQIIHDIGASCAIMQGMLLRMPLASSLIIILHGIEAIRQQYK